MNFKGGDFTLSAASKVDVVRITISESLNDTLRITCTSCWLSPLTLPAKCNFDHKSTLRCFERHREAGTVRNV